MTIQADRETNTNDRHTACQAGEAVYLIAVEGIPDTPNKSKRRHWADRVRRTKDFRESVATQARSILAERGGTTLPRAHLTYTITRTHGAEFDFDNAIALTKCLTDGLVQSGLIADDDRSHLSYDLPIRQVIGPERAVGIKITEVWE